ncbi:TIGR02594 family protein [Ningiella sp. W23]|uniref:NlpC/P60 family protein n=1 Tax=Ningiella sp. W23 TaxID=3023715 RepID=UPI0037564910
MRIIDIQKALKHAGFDPGQIDGIHGRNTTKAIKAFQKENGLKVDGLVGRNTIAALVKANASNEVSSASNDFDIPLSMPWMSAAHNLMGTQEVPGRGSNEAIMGWAEDLELTSYDDDDIPWCGLFVGHCVGSQLPDEPLPNNVLGARKWQKLGNQVEPRFGAIMVFWRGSRDGWKGHVGFYWAEDDDAYHILGGNQSNSVTITRIAKNRLLSARWPDSALEQDVHTRIAAVNGRVLSVNEA